MSNWKPDIPYNDLPPLPPKQDIESKTILKRCIAARASLARLKQAAELIPNQAMLIIGVLQEIAIGRDKLFIHPRLMELLRGEGNSFTSFQSLVKA
ncbi:TPA: hypothetical protein WHT58_001790 [Neisseria meningitidis]